MASGRIKGITIEIGGDTKKLTDSLKSVDSSIKNTQAQLKDVNKLLKLDPTNVDLLKQKHELLGKAVDDTKKRQQELKTALEQAKNAGDTSLTQEQQNALQRELIETTENLKNLEKEFAASNPTLQEFSQNAANVAEKTRGISTAAAGAAVGMIGMATAAASNADDLATLARNTGFTVEEIQKMQYAADFVDVSMESMTGSVKKLTKQMASGSDAFEKLGVSITDENGEMRNAVDVWYDSLSALSKVENATERDQLAMDLFGKSAMDLSGIIDDGGAELRRLGEEAENTGLILSGEAVDAAVEFNDQVDRLKNTATQAFFSAGAALADSLVPAMEKLVDIVVQVLSWFGNLDGTTQTVILTVLALIAAVSPLATLLASLTTIVTTLSAVFAFITSPIGLVVLAIGALIAAGVLLYQNWDQVKAAASSLWQSLSATFSNIYNAAAEKFNAVKDAISSAIQTAKDTVLNAVNAIKNAFNFSWSLPNIRLPHFHVSGGVAPYGIGGKGSLPSFSVDWYKKAYDNAILFSSPTVLPTIAGLKGFGDGNGSELVIGTNKLRELVGAAGNNITVNVMTQPGMNEAAVADAVALKLDRWLGERL